jgi:hypothetical protein
MKRRVVAIREREFVSQHEQHARMLSQTKYFHDRTVDFASSFTPKRLGDFTVAITKTPYNSKIGLSFSHEKRPYPDWIFQARFTVNDPKVQPSKRVEHLFPKAKRERDIVVVNSLHGREGFGELNTELNETLDERWQTHLMKELIEHAKKSGFRGICLKKPEITLRGVVDWKKRLPRLKEIYYKWLKKLD